MHFRDVNQKTLVTRLTNPLYIYHSLSIQWNSIRLGGHAHGIGTQAVHETLPASIYCLSKTGLCVVISSHISFQFIKEVVSYLFCMTLLSFLVSMLLIVRDFKLK